MVALYTKYRPSTFSEVVGQERALRRVKCLMDTCGLCGQVIALTGESGTGKTTIGRLIANKVADEFAIEEIDAQDVTLDLIREWQRKAQAPPLFGSGYAFIVNEFHGLSNAAVSRLQTVLEDDRVQRFSTWIFTTTTEGQKRLFGAKHDALPFMSRAVSIELEFTSETLTAMAQRTMEIAQAEEVDGRPLADYIQLAKDCKGNMRAMLQQVASGAML